MLRTKPLSKAEQERIVKNAGVPLKAGLNWLLKRNIEQMKCVLKSK